MDILIKDGVNYIQSDFHGKEKEFEEIVFTQYKHLFGESSILFTKQKIKTATGIGTIPDGFIIDFKNDKWFIIEIEISNHNVYEHIVPQVTKFKSALNHSDTRKTLKKYFEKEINTDPFKTALLISNGRTEVFKTISEIVDSNPELIIIIEQDHQELTSVFSSLPFQTRINVFKTFTREGFEQGDNIFQIEPISLPKHKTVLKTEILKETKIQEVNKSDNGQIPKFAKTYIKGLNDENNLISKMLNYIKTNKTVTWGELRKVCVTEFGCKDEKSGSIAGSLGALQHFKKIKINGHGDNKTISLYE